MKDQPATLVAPTTPEEQAEVDYGQHLIWRLVGSTITEFGANESGDIYLRVIKNGTEQELIVGKDERGDIALFEVQKEAPTYPNTRGDCA